MANPRHNTQTTNRRGAMGGGMMKKRPGYRGGKSVNGRSVSKFGMLSVKAGIDKNPKPTAADRIAGAKMKNKGKAQ